MASILKALILALVALALVTGVVYVTRWVAVHRCLDSGGRWDHETSECKGGAP